MKKSWDNLLWGLFFLGGAGVILLHMFDLLGDTSIWLPLISIPFAASFITDIFDRDWWSLCTCAGILVFIWRRPLESALDINISFWAVVGLFFFLALALEVIFKNKKKSKFGFSKTGPGTWEYTGSARTENAYSAASGNSEPIGEGTDGEHVVIEGRFSGSSRYITSKNLKHVTVSNEFGGIEVYFDGAELAPEGAVVEVHNKFGGVELYIPRRWNVITDIKDFVGGTDVPKTTHIEGAPTLTIRGNNSFGGIDIAFV